MIFIHILSVTHSTKARMKDKNKQKTATSTDNAAAGNMSSLNVSSLTSDDKS